MLPEGYSVFKGEGRGGAGGLGQLHWPNILQDPDLKDGRGKAGASTATGRLLETPKLHPRPAEPESNANKLPRRGSRALPRDPKASTFWWPSTPPGVPSLSSSLLESSSVEDNNPSAHISLSHRSHTHSSGPNELTSIRCLLIKNPLPVLTSDVPQGLLLPKNLRKVKAARGLPRARVSPASRPEPPPVAGSAPRPRRQPPCHLNPFPDAAFL